MNKTAVLNGIDGAMGKIRSAKNEVENCRGFLDRNQIETARAQIRIALDEINFAMSQLNSARAQLVIMP
jgi:hypothetical protein